jgi:hypothetical protein
MRLALKNDARVIHAHVESLLVENQINETYEAKDTNMARYLQVCKGIIKGFQVCDVIHVPRSQNKKADALSKMASYFEDPSMEVKVEELALPTIYTTTYVLFRPWKETGLRPYWNILLRVIYPREGQKP